jgi:hypothetical protein
MQKYIERFWCWLRQHDHTPRYFVRMTHDYGTPPTLVGPMELFAAEWFVINDLAHHPFHFNRRVVRARIIGDR